MPSLLSRLGTPFICTFRPESDITSKNVKIMRGIVDSFLCTACCVACQPGNYGGLRLVSASGDSRQPGSAPGARLGAGEGLEGFGRSDRVHRAAHDLHRGPGCRRIQQDEHSADIVGPIRKK